MSEVVSDPLGLSPEQREIQAVCREFAEREIRPVAAEVDEADTQTPLEPRWASPRSCFPRRSEAAG